MRMDFSSFKKGQPWPWFMSDNSVDSELVSAWVEHFPVHALKKSERLNGSDKTYLCSMLNIYSDFADKSGAVKLHDSWRQLIDYVSGDDYKRSASQLLNMDLSGAFIEIVLNMYEQDCYMSPHTDRPPKLATHLIYLTGNGDHSVGGEFVVHHNHGAPAESVAPQVGRSLVFGRTNESLHSVSTVTKMHQRKSIQIVFWQEPPPSTLPGRKIYQ